MTTPARAPTSASPPSPGSPAPLGSRWWPLTGILALLAATTLAHYSTGTDHQVSHDLFRRLYYVPIVWAAFSGGLRLGLLAVVIAVVAYVPHAFLLPHHLDPASTLDKAMEIALYLGVGTLAGLLVDRERRANRRAAREAVERLSAQKDAERFQGLVHLTRGLAHEIRNPLGSIQGAIEILAAAVPPERPEHEMATIGLREVARLNRVLTDFLAFARPRPPELRPLAPADAVSHVVDLLASEASSRGVTLRRGTVTAPEAIGDADQVTQVLVNLVRNAIAASPAGARVEVAVSSQDLDGRPGVLFEVSDEGPGVPAALGAAIYDPYVTGREDGTGLGLSIASALAQQQNGLLGHHGREGGGAVFWFRLPASAEEAA